MSDFFSSDMVQNSIMELTMLQQQLASEMPYLPRMNYKQKVEHLSTLKTFLEKQKLFFFRISLSDDPNAIEMKEKLMEAAKMFGVQDEINTMDAFFTKLTDTIEKIEASIDK
tara:strand:- start:207 stop:542 length:336 start_codon:yes stop_codon:yes gene_type:complete